MKTQYCYKDGFGYSLLVPKEPLPSMLFLEVIRDYNREYSHKITFTIQDYNETGDGIEGEFFLIHVYLRRTAMDKEFYIDAAGYINANS